MHVFSEIDDSIVLLIINVTLGSDDGYYVYEPERFQHVQNGARL